MKTLLLLVPGIVWGLSFIVVELILPFIPPLSLTLARTLISVTMLLLLMYLAKSPMPKGWTEWRPFFILAAINQAIPFALSSWGQIYIEGGLASILLSTMPLFTMLLAFWFMEDEPLTRNKLIGVGLGLFGIVVLIGPTALGGLSSNVLAQLAVIGSALLYSIGAIYTRYVYPLQPKNLTPWALRLRIISAQFVATAIMLIPFSLLIDKPWTLRPQLTTLFYLLFLGIGVTLLASMVYFYLIEQFGAAIASTTTYLIPVSGVLAGMLFLAEKLSLTMLLALVFILTGIFVANQRPRQVSKLL